MLDSMSHPFSSLLPPPCLLLMLSPLSLEPLLPHCSQATPTTLLEARLNLGQQQWLVISSSLTDPLGCPQPTQEAQGWGPCPPLLLFPPEPSSLHSLTVVGQEMLWSFSSRAGQRQQGQWQQQAGKKANGRGGKGRGADVPLSLERKGEGNSYLVWNGGVEILTCCSHGSLPFLLGRWGETESRGAATFAALVAASALLLPLY